MTTFTEAGHRKTRIFGIKGELYGDGDRIDVPDFLTNKHSVIETSASGVMGLKGHGCGASAVAFPVRLQLLQRPGDCQHLMRLVDKLVGLS